MNARVFNLLIMFFLISCNPKIENKTDYPKKNDWDAMNLKGNVKSIKTSTYKAVDKFGIIEKGERTRKAPAADDSDIQFSRKGHIILKCTYELNGDLSRKWTYKFDVHNNLIEKCMYNDSVLMIKEIFKYNNYGKQELNVFDSKNKLNSKTIYKYDSKGYIQEENVYDDEGDLWLKFVFEYNEKGKLISEKEYSPKSSILMEKIYRFDKKGKIIMDSTYYKDNGDPAWHKYIYNHGLLIEEIGYSFYNGHEYKQSYTKYDGNSNVTEWIRYFNDGTILMGNTYKYDNNGMLIERIELMGNGDKGAIYSYKMDYDKNGNYIKTICFKNHIPVYIEERDIKYFDE